MVLEAIGGALASVLLGAATNRLDGPIARYEAELEAALRDGLPKNHHAPRAVLRAAVRALNLLARTETLGSETAASALERRGAEEFEKRLKAWTRSWSKGEDVRLEAADVAAMVAGVTSALSAGGGAASRDLARQRREAATAAVRAALVAAVKPTEAFLARFDGAGEGRGWFATFAEFVAHELKHDDDFRAIFEATQLARLQDGIADLAADVKAIGRRLDEVLEIAKDLRETKRLSPEAVHLSEAQLMGLLREIAKAGLPDDAIEGAIRGGAAELIKLRDELRRHTNARGELEALRQRAAEEIDRIDIPAARRTLTDLKERQLAAGKELILGAVSATSRLARLDYAAAKYLDAARQHAEAAGLARAFDAEEWARQKILEADALDEHGRIFPGLQVLTDAVKAHEAALEVYTKEKTPSEWAMAQNNLANSLQTLGGRLGGEAGAIRLAEAVGAYGAALQVRTKEAMPYEWAMTQNNLGAVLQTLGERLGGEEGARCLAEAVKAYEAVLQVITKETAPSDWAMTQNNLGNAHRTLGEQLSGEACMERLADAAKAYEAALEVYTKEATPSAWAMTHNNIGAVHQTLGERLAGALGAAPLADAVKAYETALEVYTKEATPSAWATIQSNLGNSFQTLGWKLGGEAGAKHLADAVKACEAALEVYTKDGMPSDWAMTQNNLGNALASLGELRGGEAGARQLAKAVKAFEAALEVFGEQMPWYADRTRANLTGARAALDRLN